MSVTFPAAAILAIPETEPERLFGQSAQLQDAYKALMKLWHPDTNKDAKASDVAAHINRLKMAADAKLAAGVWVIPGLLEISGRDGITRKIRYRRHHPYDLGDLYISDTKLVYVLKNDYADLFEHSRQRLKAVRFDSQKRAAEINMLLPKVKARFEAVDGSCVLVLEKTADVFLLKDLLAHVGGRIDPRHIAWMMNCFYNLACWLDWDGNTFNAWTLDNILISPKYHSALLLGGWWFSRSVGSKLDLLPRRAIDVVPSGVRREKKADKALDLAMIKALGRELLGDWTGMTLGQNPDIPKAMVQFLRGPIGPSAVDDYATWSTQVLPNSFGVRRFVEWPVNASDIYK